MSVCLYYSINTEDIFHFEKLNLTLNLIEVEHSHFTCIYFLLSHLQINWRYYCKIRRFFCPLGGTTKTKYFIEIITVAFPRLYHLCTIHFKKNMARSALPRALLWAKNENDFQNYLEYLIWPAIKFQHFVTSQLNLNSSWEWPTTTTPPPPQGNF